MGITSSTTCTEVLQIYRKYFTELGLLLTRLIN